MTSSHVHHLAAFHFRKAPRTPQSGDKNLDSCGKKQAKTHMPRRTYKVNKAKISVDKKIESGAESLNRILL